MKKLILLPLLALFVASCSTDDISSDVQESQLVTADEAANRAGGLQNTLPVIEPPIFENGCFNYADGEVTINLPGGLGSLPEITFHTQTYGAGSATYNVRLEIETLVDCEDLELGTGQIISPFVGNFTNLDALSPSITLNATDLPADCYRWRFRFEKKNAGRYPCTSYTLWYDAPLY